jgi:hypothetical protein
MASTTTMYRGTLAGNDSIDEGDCLADSAHVAGRYAARRRNGAVQTVEIDLDGLTVHRVDGFDPMDCSGFYPGDQDLADWQDRGVDVLVYDDVDDCGEGHETYRIVSARGAAAARIVD